MNEEQILTPRAKEFLESLHRRFNPLRKELLNLRAERQLQLNQGVKPDFLSRTAQIRSSNWKVGPIPKDLERRWVEITGPAERKMMINALNSGADVFMVDFEDSLSPTWSNVIEGQHNIQEAVRRTLQFTSPEGKKYALKPELATLVVRPRGWHLVEKNFVVDGEPMSASLFDFGLFFFHNAKELIARGSGPYFYLPKMESHLEARLWNAVFIAAQEELVIPRGTIRATVLIETILAAFEMDEILYELREHSSGLNAGRWDYIFSIIKKFHAQRGWIFPDRGQITMTVPFMRAYTDLLVQTCHRRGAHAMGGMAAFIPSRKDPEINKIALAKVREDKQREIHDGFDGTWVAHPDLVPIARQMFADTLKESPHQIAKELSGKQITAQQLLNFAIPNGTVSEEGIRQNISVALQYIDFWLKGVGAVALNNLMEDAATAEISRSQLWQWHHNNLGNLPLNLYRKIVDEEQKDLYAARDILDRLVLDGSFAEFLTLIAYEQLKD